VATTHSLGTTQRTASSDYRAAETASDSDRAVSSLQFFLLGRHARKSSCNCSDAKWIARWFKRINNPAKKSKKTQSKVGRVNAFSESQPAVATTTTARSIDDEFDSVNSAANLAKSAPSDDSPNQFSSGDALGHAALFSPRSRIISASVRSPTTCLRDAGRRPQSWESEHMTMAPPDLQVNRECPISYVHSSQGSNPGFPLSNLDLAGQPRRSPLIAAIPTYDLSPFRHGDALSPIGASMEAPSVGSHDPHTLPGAGIGLLQPSYAHLDLVSESSALAPAYTDLGHTLHHLDPAAAATAAARTRASIGLPVVPDLDSDMARLGPSSVPLPSIYWLLFDMDCDSIDQLRDGSVSSLSPPRLPSGNAGGTGTALPQHGPVVAPTPVSFMAKWEDMLALERRVRSSSRSLSRNHDSAADMPQFKRVPEVRTQSHSQSQAQAQGSHSSSRLGD
jgi:hypothetical protein